MDTPDPVCVCGESLSDHPTTDNHSFVNQAEYFNSIPSTSLDAPSAVYARGHYCLSCGFFEEDVTFHTAGSCEACGCSEESHQPAVVVGTKEQT